jgi:predicted SAM-dependent methyltransferase
MRLLRNLVDRATTGIGWLRRHHRLTAPADKCIKVNLGCGLSVAPDWINIDGSLNALLANLPHSIHPLAYRLSGAHQYYDREEYCRILRENRFIHHNLSYGIPLPDATADFVYSSHFLEHLDRATGKRLLQETYRILKPGGTVRIGVPDLEYAWIMYQHGEKERMLHDYFFIDDATGYSQHRYLYDYDMLSRLLKEIGFAEVLRTKFQVGRTPDLELLDNRADYTLFVEARHPTA